MYAPGGNGGARSAAGPAPGGASDSVVLVVHVGQPGKRIDFSLSREMVESNAPCYFSALCSDQAFFAESATREVNLVHKDPEIFSHIYRFLQGYKIRLDESQRRELEAVKADASYFGLTKLLDEIDEMMMAKIKANLGPQVDFNARDGKVVDVLDRRRLQAARLIGRAGGRLVLAASAMTGVYTDSNNSGGESPGTGSGEDGAGIYLLELNNAHVLLYYDLSRIGYCDLFWRRGQFLAMKLDHHANVAQKIRVEVGPNHNVQFSREIIWATSGYVVIDHRNWRYHFTPEDIDFYITSSDFAPHACDPKYRALLSVTCASLHTFGQFVAWRVSNAVTMCEVHKTGENSFIARHILLQVEIDAGTNSTWE